jgi:class 3 adenylate cyclase
MPEALLSSEEVLEPRYDSAILPKVAALAARLQNRHQESLTAREMEAIGTEVGLEPAFIRDALTHFTRRESPSPARNYKAWAAGWWAAGWTLPIIGAIVGGEVGNGAFGGLLFFISLALYIGTGVLLSHTAGDSRPQPPARLPRVALLEMLFTLQRELEGRKHHRAFLSVDVVGSSEMKRDASELAVEYSFSQFRLWVERIVAKNGGEMQSAAGDGVMCVFPTDTAAVRAARQLQEGLPRFNEERNRLPTPFRIRCGVSAGHVALEEGMPLGHLHSPVIDRAAALQKQAAPGGLLVGGEVAAAALMELEGARPLPEPVDGAPAFSWRAGHTEPPALP